MKGIIRPVAPASDNDDDRGADIRARRWFWFALLYVAGLAGITVFAYGLKMFVPGP